jgi:hypothetical protein
MLCCMLVLTCVVAVLHYTLQFHTDRARNNEEDRELRFVRGGGGLNAADNAGSSTSDNDNDPPASAIGNGATAVPTVRGTAFPTTFGGAGVTVAPTLSGTANSTATGTAAGTAAATTVAPTTAGASATTAPSAGTLLQLKLCLVSMQLQ